MELVSFLQSSHIAQHQKRASSRPWNKSQRAFSAERKKKWLLEELAKNDIQSYVQEMLESPRTISRV